MQYCKDVLTELEKIGSVSSKHNRLIKICNNTNDKILASLLREYCDGLKRLDRTKKGRLPLNISDVENDNVYKRINLISYCQQVVSTGKPEWQVLAERHGWVPTR